MKIKRNIEVPTGNILIAEGEKGKDLEFLSLGDYGQAQNVKASFLGLDKDIDGVPNGEIMPLGKKWVITISTQYGCSMDCSFCDVPKVGPGYNATAMDMINQVQEAIKIHPEVSFTDRLNIHFARMGEPSFNASVIDAARSLCNIDLKCKTIHPVVSTMMPKNNKCLYEFLNCWIVSIKNKLYNGEAGLQLSINTTSDSIRNEIMPMAMDLREISDMMCDILQYSENGLKGRKIALNFALTDAEIDAEKLNTLFSPKYFMCKLTPMHLTHSCVDNDLITKDGYSSYYSYKKVEEDLKKAGFDVLVFIPSKDEDLGRITCGNAILSGSVPETLWRECKI